MVIAGAALIYPQDTLRYVAIAERQTKAAVVSDAFRLTGSLAAVSVTFLDGDTRLLIAFWLASAAASLIYISAQLQVFSLSRRSNGSLLPTSDLKLLAPNALLATTGPLFLAYAIASFLSFDDVAAVRGGSTLIGPVSLLLGAIPLVLLPEMSRRSNNARRYIARTQSGFLLFIVLIWGAMVSLLPPSLGASLLGETWMLTKPIWILVVIEYCAWALAAGPQAELQAYRLWGHLLLSKVTYLVATLVAMVFAFRAESLHYVMMGLALTAVLNLIVVSCFRALHVTAQRIQPRRTAS